MYLSDIYTAAINLAGIPAIAVPFSVDSQGLPIGVQLLAPPLREDLLLRLAYALEQQAETGDQRTTQPSAHTVDSEGK